MTVYGIYRGHPEGYTLEMPLYLNKEMAFEKAELILELAIEENEDSKRFCIEECNGHGLDMYPDWKQESETRWAGGFEQSINVSEIEVI